MDQKTFDRATKLNTLIAELKSHLASHYTGVVTQQVSAPVQKAVRTLVLADLKEQLEVAEAEFKKLGEQEMSGYFITSGALGELPSAIGGYRLSDAYLAQSQAQAEHLKA